MTFKEVNNEQFDDIYDESEIADIIYGTNYGTAYETLDTSKEYGHMIFKDKQEAMTYLKNKGVAVK